jgi:hypothetical protein
LDALERSRQAISSLADFVGYLQIHPKSLSSAEESRKPNRRIRSDAPFLENDVVDTWGRYADVLGELVGSHLHGLQEFFPQNFSRMDYPRLIVSLSSIHAKPAYSFFNGSRQFRRRMRNRFARQNKSGIGR